MVAVWAIQRHCAAFQLIDAADDLLPGFGRVHGQIGERGFAFDHHFGGELVHGREGNIEGAQAEHGGGISGAAFERDEPQRDGGRDGALGDGREHSAAAGERNGIAEFARDDHFAGMNRLALAQREPAFGFEVIAQSPFAVDPDAFGLCVAFAGARANWR